MIMQDSFRLEVIYRCILTLTLFNVAVEPCNALQRTIFSTERSQVIKDPLLLHLLDHSSHRFVARFLNNLQCQKNWLYPGSAPSDDERRPSNFLG